MSNRYLKEAFAKNESDFYKNYFIDRNVKFINHYPTQTLFYPTQDQINQLDLAEHVWSQHDRFWRLAENYYGNPEYWWVISFFNKKPTEAEVLLGDLIIIPLPLERIIYYIKG